jgi:CRP/FNR family transcriptional regulator, polysaccharide utilization system transcription regulator
MMLQVSCLNCEIQKNNCFSLISREDLIDFDEKKRSTIYKKNQVVFYAGRQPTGIFCLKSGKVKIAKTGIDGKDQIVRFVTNGELLGIRALVGGRQYSATATVLEDSVICYITKHSFFKIILKYPAVSKCLMKSLSQMLEEAEDKMTSMAQKPVRERLAESLIILNNVFQSGRPDCPSVLNPVISLSRVDLANLTGTATETVIRLLSEFKEEKLVEIYGRKIKLLDIDRLLKVGKINP